MVRWRRGVKKRVRLYVWIDRACERLAATMLVARSLARVDRILLLIEVMFDVSGWKLAVGDVHHFFPPTCEPHVLASPTTCDMWRGTPRDICIT